MKQFHLFRLDPINHRLWRGDERVTLTPKAFDVLRFLVQHADRLVTQQEILEAVWPETHVNPEVVKKYVLEVRKALGDRSDRPTFIETMTRSSILTITPPARVMAHRLLAGADTWLPVPSGYQALTAALLPPRLRDAFALRYGQAERDGARQFIAHARRLYSFLPFRLRYVGPYQEAEQRLAGRTQPDFLARMCNRFWMGQSALGRWPA